MSKPKHQKQPDEILKKYSSKVIIISKFNIHTVHLKYFGKMGYP